MPRIARARRLLEPVAAMSSDLSLPVVLRRIVASACELVEAQYTPLGVLGPGTNVEQIRLIHITTKPEVADRIQQAVDELDTTIRDIRGVIFALQAHEHGRHGLRLDVLRLVAEMKTALGFEARIHSAGLSMRLSTTCLRANCSLYFVSCVSVTWLGPIGMTSRSESSV